MGKKITVVLFLRGGTDGLNLIAPSADDDYIAARPEILRVLRDDGFAMKNGAGDTEFRFHAEAGGLSDLYDAGHLAVIHAAGLTDGTRSHFEAEDMMERAAKGATAGGWMGRWLANTPVDGILPALAVGGSAPESLRGAMGIAVAEALDQLVLPEGPDFELVWQDRLRAGFGGHPLMSAPMERLLSLSGSLRGPLEQGYTANVDYPDTDLAAHFKTVAQSIKLDLGLRVASIDYGGWDTHEAQAPEFARLAGTLSDALNAFWRDLGQRAEDVVVVVMSEFGRRLRSNSTEGTDHGFGNAMMVLGGDVAGGQMLGEWPGLSNEALDSGTDLAITTDYRHVLSEVMTHHMGGASASVLFPEFEWEGRGIFG